jgi:hypothetical protein
MTTETRWGVDQLNQFEVDCSDPYQREMLESQRVSREDYIKNGIILTSVTGTILSLADGTYEERMKIRSGSRTNTQKLTEYFREKQCRKEAFDKQFYR